MPDQDPIQTLEAEKIRLFNEMSALGDFRRGSIQTIYRKCGKDTCSCAQPEHPGHGPMLIWTRSVNGKTVTKKISDAELGKLQRELDNYRRFKRINADLVTVSEQICELRPPAPALAGLGSGAGGAQRGGSTRVSPSTSGRSGRRRS